MILLQETPVTLQGIMETRDQCDTGTPWKQEASVTQLGLMELRIQYDTAIGSLQGPMETREKVTGLVGLA